MKKSTVSAPEKTLSADDAGSDVSRREFVKSVAAVGAVSATGSLAADTVNKSTSRTASNKRSTNHDYDVAIIGAGLAGITAARELRQRGFSSLILEARNRSGGRVFTSKFAGHKVELGGNWTFWGNPHMWAEITRYGLSLEAELGTSQPEDVYWLTEGKVKKGDFFDVDKLLRGPVNTFFDDALEVFANPHAPIAGDAYAAIDALSAQDGINNKDFGREQRDLVSAFMSAVCSNFNKEVSLLQVLHWYRLHGSYTSYGDATIYKIREGTNALVDAIVADGRPEIALATPITSVKQERDKVVLTTESGDTASARAAIIAVPVNTLDDIEFLPLLMPEKTQMAKQRHGGSGVKFYARINGKRPPLMAFAPDTAPATMLFTVHRLEDSSIVCGFGPSPKLVDINDDEQIQTAIRQWLPKVEVVESYGYDWNVDPYSQGMWCAFRPTQITSYLKALQQPEGRLFFAGGDIANGFRGFMDGAVETGLRAGREVAEFLA